MSSSSISFLYTNVQHRKPFPIERRPKLLKDFLNDNSNSCSSSGFKSFPRHQPLDSKSRNSNSNPKTPSTTISAFQALINALKNITFTTVKSPFFLPRSLSRRLSKRESKSTKTKNEVKVSVRVKDILRWTSFRDVVEETSPPSDFSPSPHHYTITTTGSTNDSSSNSNSSSLSWCESDFTAEFLSSWCGNSDEKEFEMGKKKLPCADVDFVDATINTERDPQDGEVLLYDEDEQQSPVSVFDFQFRKINEEPFSTFDQSLANVERTSQQLIQKIKELESLSNLEKSTDIDDKEDDEEENNSNYDEENEEDEEEDGGLEERARELLVHVKATSSTKVSKVEEELLFDFFRDELEALENQCSKYGGCNWDMVTLARAWIGGECNAFEYGLEYDNRVAYIREMNKVGNWSKFEVEQEELALEIGDGVLVQLIDDLLIDLLIK